LAENASAGRSRPHAGHGVSRYHPGSDRGYAGQAAAPAVFRHLSVTIRKISASIQRQPMSISAESLHDGNDIEQLFYEIEKTPAPKP
jgi:hypothetical protein